MPSFNLQDPFITKIGELIVFGGVEVEGDDYRTKLYIGEELTHLDHLLDGPDKMKDIRLVDLGDVLGVFTRPQGEVGGRGQIGFTTVDSLGDLSTQVIDEAPLLGGGFFLETEWGGVNEARLLDDGTIGVLGHIARFTDGPIPNAREYYPFTFKYDYQNGEISDSKIIATRDCFPASDAKRPDLRNIIFPGGMIVNGDTAELYVGLSDAAAGICTIDNPF